MSRKVLLTTLFAATAIAALLSLYKWYREYGPLDEERARARWDETWSGPRYERADCIVRIDVKLGPGHDDAWNRWHQDFMRYVINHEPRALFDAGHGRQGEIYLQFFGECDRRYHIARGMVAYFSERQGERLAMTIRDDRIQPGPDTIQSCGRQWIDCKR